MTEERVRFLQTLIESTDTTIGWMDDDGRIRRIDRISIGNLEAGGFFADEGDPNLYVDLYNVEPESIFLVRPLMDLGG